jgi:hypothetical protein
MELLFRAWDGEKMIYMNEGERLDSFFLSVQIKSDIFDRKCEITQFTGMIDKNGIKVFKGDKVRHKFIRIWKTEYHESTVVWSKEWCCYYLFDGTMNYRMRDDMEYEVTGNIYETEN